LIFALLLGVGISIASAGDAAAESGSRTSASMLSLDEQVQEVKSDLLAIAAELSNLEEQLLYPSNTQISVFVSIEEGHAVSLDSARVLIDGELVAQHIYSFKELEALQKGGVQRIYTGNIHTGEHRIEVSIAGKKGGGKDFDAVESFVFSKAEDPKLVGIRLANRSSGDATIAIEGW
jgi:archaellum component FlaG (FlaF/FlaG flagellin family)